MIAIFAVLLQFAWASVQPSQTAKPIQFGTPKAIATLNPYNISGVDSYTVTGFVLEPLARIEPGKSELKPWLATRWSVAPGKKTVKIWLRPNVRFHNGDAFTVEDLIFTWSSYFKPEYKGSAWQGMWSDIEEIRAVSPLVAEVRFKSLTYQNFQNLMTALRILPHGFYGTLDTEKWNTQMVGTGAYQVAKFDEGRALQLSPNPSWWGWKEFGLKSGAPVLVKPVPDALLARQMRDHGELDVFALAVGEGLEFPSTKGFKDRFGTGVSVGFNLRNPLLADVGVRKALKLAWNRSALNRKIFKGRFQLALDSFTPTTAFYPKGRPLEEDLSKASRELKKLGFLKADGDGVLYREGKNGPEKLIFRAVLHSPESARWMGLLQADLAKVGVRVIADNVGDESQWLKLVDEGKFDLLAYEGSLSDIPHISVWHSKGPYNSSGLRSEKVDHWLEDLDAEFVPAKRHRILRSLIVELRNQAVEMPGLVTGETRFLVSERVTLDPKRPFEPWYWRKKD